MKTVKLQFVKNEEDRYAANIVLPGRINFYARLESRGSIKAYAKVEGISLPVEVGVSEYTKTPALDINLIAGTEVVLVSQRPVAEAVYVED